MKNILLFIAIGLMTASCYWDNAEYLYPKIDNGSCDTSNVTLSGSVMPILSGYCLTCHSSKMGPNLGGNIVLDTYQNLKVYADNGQLYGSITGTNGLPLMPLGSSQLGSCQIATIKKWIDLGTPNN